MAFDWKTFLALAEALAAKSDAASKRTSISRAYYCIFNIAFARAEKTAGPCPREERSHAWCWRKYEATPDPSCRRLGDLGTRMKERRVRADYNGADIAHLDDDVRRTLDEARRFLSALDTLDKRYPLP
jgi:hypothetical protein